MRMDERSVRAAGAVGVAGLLAFLPAMISRGDVAWDARLAAALLHALDAVLLFLATRCLLARASGSSLGEDPALSGAVAAALVFSLHPQRAELVACAELRLLLAATLLLLSLLLYLRAAEALGTVEPRGPLPERAAGASAGKGLLAASACAYALSLASHPAGLLFPGALLALDFYPLRRRAFAEKVPFLVLAAALGAVRLHGALASGRLLALSEFGALPRLAAALFSSVFYLEKALLPAGLRPVYDEVLPCVLRLHPFGNLCVPRTLAFAALTVLAWRSRKERPAFLAAWLSYLALVLPVSGLLKTAPAGLLAADRWSYIPSLAWAPLAGAALAGPGPADLRLRGARSRAAAALLLALALLSARQARLWARPEELWLAAARLDPACQTCVVRAAEIHLGKGELGPAGDRLQDAIVVHPTAEAYLLAAQVKARIGDLGSAATYLSGAAELDRGEALRFCREKEALYARASDYLDSVIYEDFALRLQPSPPSTDPQAAPPDLKAWQRHLSQGLAFSQAGRREEAVAETRLAVAANPGDPVAHNNLGYFLMAQGALDESIQQFREALRLDPGMDLARRNLFSAASRKK